MTKVTEFGTLSFLSFSLIIGALVFCRGYLLNRQVLPDKSPECSWRKPVQFPGHTAEYRQLNLASTPWCNSKPIHSKAILVLVDALRFDFIHRMTFLSQLLEREEKENRKNQESLADFEPKPATGVSACAFKFIADPPTTTMQRLKALMTGTMPTFIDASANFNSYEVEEDNLIFQLSLAKKKVAFLGDDTWLSLFPRSLFTSPFVEAHPSFNAWDLDTVDRAVNNSIYRLLRTPEREDWDILIAHLLGVDHCGHRYGQNHPEMKRKLLEADSTIEHIFNTMSHDTLLVVFGDHGMTKTGDHGGDSPAETDSGLIFLSKQLKRDKAMTPPFNCHSKLKNPQSVAQIDLAPTLSTMLGLPIPFSSIGQLIPNFLTNKLYSDAVGGNVAQVARYIARYPSIANSNLTQVYDTVDEAFQNYQTLKSPETRANLHKLSEQYLGMVRSHAASTWTQFDLVSISWGICIFILALCSLLLYTIKVPVGQPHRLLFLSSTGLASVIINFALGPVFGLTGIKICTSFGLVVFFGCLLTTSALDSDKKFPRRVGSIKLFEIFSLILYAIACLTVFSNSFVINEGYVLGAALVATALLNVLLGSKKKSEWSGLMETKARSARNRLGNNAASNKKLVQDAWISLLVLTLMTRIAQLFMRCREELVDCQEVFLLHKHLASLPADWVVHKFVRYGAALLSLSVFVVSFREWMMSRYCIVSSRPASVIGKYVPLVLVVLTCVFWALEGLPFSVPNLSSIRPLFNYFPSVFQSFTLMAVLLLWIKPLCCVGNRRPSLKISRKRKSKNGIKETDINLTLKNHTASTNDVTKLASIDKIKLETSTNGYKNHENSGSEGVVLPYTPELKPDNSMLNNEYTKYPIPDTMSEDVFSSSLLIYCVLVTLLLVQISTAGITPAITMIPYTVVCLLGISGDVSNSGSWALCVMWTLASQYFFYGTGHQAVFSAIPWDSAFVGGTDTLGGAGSESWITWLRPGLAVLGNLHVSQIIFSMALPLVMYWKSNEMPETLLGSNERSKAYVIAGKWISLHALKLLACMACAALHRRHLMVWKIFAPKFIFEAISFIVTCLTTLVSLLFVTRLNYLYQCVLHSENVQLQRLLKC